MKAGTATAVLGGLSTLAASYLARMRGSEEPEKSRLRSHELSNFIRSCEAFILDYGHIVIVENDPDNTHIELEHHIIRLRTKFEEIVGNNNVDGYLAGSSVALLTQNKESRPLA